MIAPLIIYLLSSYSIILLIIIDSKSWSYKFPSFYFYIWFTLTFIMTTYINTKYYLYHTNVFTIPSAPDVNNLSPNRVIHVKPVSYLHKCTFYFYYICLKTRESQVERLPLWSPDTRVQSQPSTVLTALETCNFLIIFPEFKSNILTKPSSQPPNNIFLSFIMPRWLTWAVAGSLFF